MANTNETTYRKLLAEVARLERAFMHAEQADEQVALKRQLDEAEAVLADARQERER